MTTKVCTNSKCPAYAHFVYTVAMRCVLCRCDLMAAQRSLQVAGAGVAEARSAGARLAQHSVPASRIEPGSARRV